MTVLNGIEIFSTCISSSQRPGSDYLDHARDVARWSEQSGCAGMLVYTDNSLVDPWLVAQAALESTARLAPLVAVQPIYMHPYYLAKIIASIAHLRGRRVHLNMVAGGFKNDLEALDDQTPHDRRYDRLVEYTSIVTSLLADDGPVDFDGEFYRVRNLRLAPSCPPELRPGVFVSGSSEAGRAAARAIGATAIEYPKPADELGPVEYGPSGIRIGVISRDDSETAWSVAHARFPTDRTGQLRHQLAMKVSDSVWHQQLSRLARESEAGGRHPYWLVPFENYRTMCPYLVGDYREVGAELAGYIRLGYRTFITDIPADPEELCYIGRAFEHAMEVA